MRLPFFERFWGFHVFFAQALGLAHAVHAILKVRSPQGAVGWALALITFPYVAAPLYWVFGRAKFIGYRRAKRGGSSPLAPVGHQAWVGLAQFRTDPPPDALMGGTIESPALLPPTNGNQVELLRNGAETFPALWEAIQSAQKYLLVQFFIIHDDSLGRQLKDQLAARVDAGVQVYLLYDEVGCHGLSRRYLREMRAAGIRAEPFRTTRGRGNRFQLNFRNHRKLVVADGRLALTGGLNIGEEYDGCSAEFGAWRDTHARVRGPAVQALQMPFVEDWFWATDEIPSLDWQAVSADPGEMTAQALATGPADDLDVCSLAFLRLINSARRRLWLASPYFVPDPAVLSALQLAALRGVDVRLLLPEKPDHWLPHWSSLSYYESLARCGIALYRYKAGFMHQKVTLVDDDMAVVGSINVDYRSFHLNFELAILVVDPAFAAQVSEMLEADFAKCRRVDYEEFRKASVWFRALVRTARLFSTVQ